MLGRRKVAPFCAILGAWALVTLYFFGKSGPLPTSHSLLREDEPIVRDLPHEPLAKLQDIQDNNDFNDEYKKVDHKAADEEPKEDGKVDEELKEEIKVEEVENEDQQRDRVMPAVVVPIEEREPEVDLEKLAIVNSPEEETMWVLEQGSKKGNQPEPIPQKLSALRFPLHFHTQPRTHSDTKELTTVLTKANSGAVDIELILLDCIAMKELPSHSAFYQYWAVTDT
ncbi:hypothetical protein Aduo_008810 [Ancylostoma duodenale]